MQQNYKEGNADVPDAMQYANNLNKNSMLESVTQEFQSLMWRNGINTIFDEEIRRLLEWIFVIPLTQVITNLNNNVMSLGGDTVGELPDFWQSVGMNKTQQSAQGFP